MIDTTIIFFINLFLHIVDDFYLQGIMANMKQKSWWHEQTKEAKYKYDYTIVLFLHGFSWAFMTHLVYLILYVFNPENITLRDFYAVSLVINAYVHAVIDNLKANYFKINLVQDQFLHVIQILLTLCVFTLTK